MSIPKTNNILFITKRTPWFMETFVKFKDAFDMVYEVCFDPVDPNPFPFNKYQKIIVGGNYPGYRTSLKSLPPKNIAPPYSNIYIVNTETVRFEEAPKRIYVETTTIFSSYKKTIREIPEIRKSLFIRTGFLNGIRRKIWNKEAISPDFILTYGRGYMYLMKTIMDEKDYGRENDRILDIKLTNSFYSYVGRKKILTDELKITHKL